ncbi:MAG: hypothetical protein HY397_01565 [Candidatus Doudnabacteria bacterium]|nr:hypothetical protein [Candidatus Doudnabacteria bacterium]
MRDEKTEILFEQCLTLLRLGRSVAECIKIYPQAKKIADELAIISRLSSLPKRTSALDSQVVWKKIARKISLSASAANGRQIFGHAQIPILQFAFPKGLFGLVTIVTLAGLLNSTAVAAQNSLPGQTLYPVKRTVERIELTLAVDEVKKTEVKIKHAEKRLTEAQGIVEQLPPEKEEQVIGKTIGELKNTTEEVAKRVASRSTDNKELLEKVVKLTDKQEAVLTDLGNQVSDDAKQAVTEALDTALETKSAAVKSLAELADGTKNGEAASDGQTPDATANGTSTSPILEPQTADPQTTPTSTTNRLKKLGDPNATSTEIITPLFPQATQTTTLDIIELK